ncbi:MAG: LptE family protein [Thermodesulfobacteriota bacterium]|nr:LptE family protein [Thermodesulfobacteriota bacterium]
MRFLLLFVVVSCLSGCGYHFPGQSGALPEGVEKLYIPLFINKTAEPQLENKMTNRVSEVFSRNSEISQVEKAEYAEAVLLGTIRNYNTRALSYNSNDDIGEYRSTLIVDVVLKPAGKDQSLWQGTVSWSAEYSASDDKNLQEDLEQQAIDEITLRLAEEILYQLLDDF